MWRTEIVKVDSLRKSWNFLVDFFIFWESDDLFDYLVEFLWTFLSISLSIWQLFWVFVDSEDLSDYLVEYLITFLIGGQHLDISEFQNFEY